MLSHSFIWFYTLLRSELFGTVFSVVLLQSRIWNWSTPFVCCTEMPGRERDVQWRLSNTRPVLFNRIIRNGTLHNLILRSVLFPQKLTCKRRHPLTVFWTPEIWPSSSYVWISSDLYDCSWAQISNFLLLWNYSSCDINGQLVIKEPWQLGTTVWSLWGIINSRAYPPNPTRNAIPWVEY